MPERPALHPHAAVALPPLAEERPAAPSALSVRWTISRAAAARLAPGLAPRGPDCELAMTLSAGAPRAAATLVLVDRGAAHTLRSAAVSLAFTPDGDLRHAEAPGWLSCTWRHAGDAPEADLLYLRSPLLADLGLPGGRYEPLRTVRLGGL